MDYWKRKDELKKHARLWCDKMQYEHPDSIKHSVDSTKEYAGKPYTSGWQDIYDTKFILMKADTVTAVMKCDPHKAGKTAVLNYASFKNPGGRFFDGSSAQEESLCHESTLANVLTAARFADYYAWNRKHLNFALYLDRALYSPDILFVRDNRKVTANVISCAAPNVKACTEYHPEKADENYVVLDDRTIFLREICKAEEIDTFITGAWGCGVFGQDPATVCDYFITNFASSTLKYVIFAIPDDKTYNAFWKKGRGILVEYDRRR